MVSPRSGRRPLFDDQSAQLDRFGLLLLFTVTSIVCLSLVDLDPSSASWLAEVTAAAASTLVGLSLLLALRASGLARRWQRAVDVAVLAGVGLVVVLLVVSAATGADASRVSSEAPPALLVVLAVTTPVFVVRRLLRHRRVTVQTLIGAVSVYLLIPVAFFYLSVALDYYFAPTFFGREEPTTSFMYFSLSTLTTVGYGDLSPVTNLGRLVASSEAVVGQLYLVTFVAMIVALVAQRREPRDSPSPDKKS